LEPNRQHQREFKVEIPTSEHQSAGHIQSHSTRGLGDSIKKQLMKTKRVDADNSSTVITRRRISADWNVWHSRWSSPHRKKLRLGLCV